MREIIGVGVGTTGHSLLTQVYSMLRDLDPTESEVYFRQTNGGERIPRGIWVDLDTSDQPNHSSTLDKVSVYGDPGTGNWAKGYYSIDVEGLTVFRELVRKRVEEMDSLGGFQTFHNISGGAGGGLTSRLTDILLEDYAKSISQTFSVAPNIRNGGGHAHGYNVILSLSKLQENVDRIAWIDSEVVEEKGQTLGLLRLHPHYGHMNELVSSSICDTLLAYVAPGQISCSLTYESAILCPFPDLCYTMSSSPSLRQNRHSRKYSFSDLWSPQNISNYTLSAYTLDLAQPEPSSPLLGAVLSTSHWGSPVELANLHNFLSKHTPYPCTVKVQHLSFSGPESSQTPKPCIPTTPKTAKTTATVAEINTLTVNSPRISDPLGRWSSMFQSLFSRRAFVHWFIAEGVDEAEFPEVLEAVERVRLLYAEVAGDFAASTDSEEVDGQLLGEMGTDLTEGEAWGAPCGVSKAAGFDSGSVARLGEYEESFDEI